MGFSVFTTVENALFSYENSISLVRWDIIQLFIQFESNINNNDEICQPEDIAFSYHAIYSILV